VRGWRKSGWAGYLRDECVISTKVGRIILDEFEDWRDLRDLHAAGLVNPAAPLPDMD
jgi:hypothetical protein